MDVNTNNIGPANETQGNFKDDVQENLKPIDKKANDIKNMAVDKSLSQDFEKAARMKREIKGVMIEDEGFFEDVTEVDLREKIKETGQRIFGKIKDGSGLKKDFSSNESSEKETHSNSIDSESDVSKDV
ncbi:MAG: hypothetical protein KDK62_03610 [Chlamydiia bacterium]|nr:hypothetical protein [Chlamydiia bacterium]